MLIERAFLDIENRGEYLENGNFRFGGNLHFPKSHRAELSSHQMAPFVRGLLGLGMTLFVVGATMATVNGLVRGWALKQLYHNPGDENALALLALF